MSKYDAYSFRVRAPDGTMFVVFNELQDKLDNVQIYIGKTGSNLFAWTGAVADLINLSLESGASIEDIISRLSNITSDRQVHTGEQKIRSDIDAVVYAFLKYKRQKYFEKNGTTDSHWTFQRHT